MTSIKSKSSIYGEMKLVVPSSIVSLKGKAFEELVNLRRKWVFLDHYCNPGPIQFTNFGKFSTNKTLRLEHENYSKLLNK